jgi:DNA repair protein RadA
LIKKLKSAGITNPKHLLLFNAEELMEFLNLSELDTARRVITAARELLGDEPKPMSARERVEALSGQRVVRTGVEEFDKLVGGLRFGSSYEFAGEFGAGKTIMSLQVAVASVAQH